MILTMYEGKMRTRLCFPQGHCGSSSRLGSYSRKSPGSFPATDTKQTAHLEQEAHPVFPPLPPFIGPHSARPDRCPSCSGCCWLGPNSGSCGWRCETGRRTRWSRWCFFGPPARWWGTGTGCRTRSADRHGRSYNRGWTKTKQGSPFVRQVGQVGCVVLARSSKQDEARCRRPSGRAAVKTPPCISSSESNSHTGGPETCVPEFL